MEEIKAAAYMLLSLILNSVILRIVIVILGIAAALGTLYRHVDTSKQLMNEYASYTAYDQTSIRGQDAIELITQKVTSDNIFVLVYSGEGSSSSIDDLTLGNLLAGAYPKNYSFTFSQTDFSTSKTGTVNAVNEKLKELGAAGTTVSSLVSTNYGDHDNVTYAQLQSLFLNECSKPGSIGSYAGFKSILVYESKSSNTIAGIILVRQSAYTTNFD